MGQTDRQLDHALGQNNSNADSASVSFVNRVIPSSAALTALRQKKHRRWLLIGAGAITLAIIIIIGSAIYAFWSNSPDQIVFDAMINAFRSNSANINGTLTSSGSGASSSAQMFTVMADKSNFELDTYSDLNISNISLPFDSSVILSNSILYVKLTGLKTILDKAAESGSQYASLTSFSNIVDKVEGRWISITDGDIKQLNSLTPSPLPSLKDTVVSCTQNAFSQFRSSSSEQNEVALAYLNNRFLVVDKNLGTSTINGQNAWHYLLSVDNVKLNHFISSFNKASVAKEVQGCTGIQSLEQLMPAATTVDVWITSNHHQLIKFKITSADSHGLSTTTAGSTDFVHSLTISQPASSTDFTKLIVEIQQAFTNDFLQSSFGTSAVH